MSSSRPTPRRLGRRAFLASLGLGSGVLLLDLCRRSLVKEARGAAGPPQRRFVLFVNGNGLHQERYRATVRSESDFDLPPSLAPLAPYKQDLLFVSPLYNPHNQEFHGNGWATLSMMPSVRTGGDEFGPFYAIPSGVSLDRFLAREISADTPFSSINLGLLESNDFVPHVSSDGPGRAYPAERSPVRAYARLFGALLPTPGIPTEKLLEQNRSLLDLVQGDIQRTMGRLAGPERAKLDQYLESIRALELRLGRLGGAQAACSGFAAPAARLHKLQASRGAVQPEVIQAHVELASNALQCGLTRVAAISIHGNSYALNHYEFLGDTRGHHQSCHDDNKETLTKIDAFVASQVGALYGRLRAVPEGAGTVADSSLLLWVNTGGGTHHNGWNTHGAVLLGRAGGTLRTGRYLTYGPQEHSLGDLCVSVANAVGAPIQSFGDPTHCKGPLPGLT